MYSESQLMWEDIIVDIVKNPKFNVKIGDMSYVLSNIIAKYVSSSKYYRISKDAELHLSNMNINLNEPVHIRKHVYGRDKKTILEHSIPVSITKNYIISKEISQEDLRYILRNSGFVAILTREEDERLKKNGLSRKMPTDWSGFGDNSEKRYSFANITLSAIMIEHAGPICR
jgi:hypothetical protein